MGIDRAGARCAQGVLIIGTALSVAACGASSTPPSAGAAADAGADASDEASAGVAAADQPGAAPATDAANEDDIDAAAIEEDSADQDAEAGDARDEGTPVGQGWRLRDPMTCADVGAPFADLLDGLDVTDDDPGHGICAWQAPGGLVGDEAVVGVMIMVDTSGEAEIVDHEAVGGAEAFGLETVVVEQAEQRGLTATSMVSTNDAGGVLGVVTNLYLPVQEQEWGVTGDEVSITITVPRVDIDAATMVQQLMELTEQR